LAENYGKLPLSFEANQGQTDPRVKFLSRGHGYALFLTGDEAVLALRSQKSEVRSQWENATDNGPRIADRLFPPLIQNPKSKIQNPPAPGPQPPAPEVVRLKLVGASPKAKVVGLAELPGKSNYFIGNDPKKWRTNVANYARVKYQEVYPGIDLVYYGNQQQLEYDFVVAPGGDPRAVQFELVGEGSALPRAAGGRPYHIDANGDLLITAEAGEVRFHKPVVYQVAPASGRPAAETAALRRSLDGRYILLADNRVGFEVGAYDKTLPLIIDPVLSYSTYLSGDGYHAGCAIAVDAIGNAYVTGQTDSGNFPTTPGAFQTSYGAGYMDAFVTKLNAAGSALVYSTYLGGSGYDWAGGIAVDAAGNAYVTGYTDSSDFPTTPGAFQRTYGGADYGPYTRRGIAFVAKLEAVGSVLVYSTYLGGSNDVFASGIAVDATGNAYVTGYTASSDFPTTTGAFQTSYGGGYYDAFVAKLNAAGSALVYSTYLGGSCSEVRASSIAVDASGNAYVTGYVYWLYSGDFPTTPGAFQTSFGGSGGSYSEAFITKLNADGSDLVYSTYLGGNGGYAIAVDATGNAYVTGNTYGNFPTTPGAFQTSYGGGG
jgi:hypothetical protein